MHASDCVHKSNLSFADELFAGSRFVWVKYIFQTQIKSEKKHKNVQKSDYVNGWMRQVVYIRTSPFTIKIKKSKHAEINIWVYGCALHLYLCSCCTGSPLGGGKPLFKLPDLTQQRGLMTKIEKQIQRERRKESPGGNYIKNGNTMTEREWASLPGLSLQVLMQMLFYVSQDCTDTPGMDQ